MDPFNFDKGCGPSIEGDNRNVTIIRNEHLVDFPSVWNAFPLWDGILNTLEDAIDDEDRRYELRIRNPVLNNDDLGCPIYSRGDMVD